VARYNPNGVREEIHLPGRSILPLITAVAITVALLGLIWSWWITAAGGVILLFSAVRWIRTVREDMANLPTERPR
jgi:hypothetical protein